MALQTLDQFRRSLIGYGLVRPFTRQGGSDFSAATGPALIKSAIGQILGTRRGEVRWRPLFGVNLERYRHMNITDELAADIGQEISSALSNFEPRIKPGDSLIGIEDNLIKATIRWQLKTASIPTNAVELSPESTAVTI